MQIHCLGKMQFLKVEAKRPGRGSKHPPLSSVEVKERIVLYHYSPPLGLHDLLLGELYHYISPL
jgi:hypothetical protein